MAFLPRLSPVPNVTKRRRNQTQQEPREDSKKGYRISFAHLDEQSNTSSHDPSITPRSAKQSYYYAMSDEEPLKCTDEENSIVNFGDNHPKPHRLQSLKKPEQTEPMIAPEKCMLQWLDPLGLWIPTNRGRRFYQKFSSRIDLSYKHPDDFMDPCPHIPRCNHACSWSAVKLERQKFRELSRLRNEQSLCRTIERYRNMQDLWSQQQMYITNEVLNNASSQERLEKFRKVTGECFTPLSETERLERLVKRRQEWEDAWRMASERQKKNSTKKKRECNLFPRIIITNHDNEGNTREKRETSIDGIFNETQVQIRTSCGEHVRAREEHVTACRAHVRIYGEHATAYGEQVITCGEHVTVNTSESRCARCDHVNDKYDILCAPVNCCYQLSQNLKTVRNNEKQFLVQQADYIEERICEVQFKESFAVIRRTPRVDESRRGLDSTRTIPKDSNKSCRISEDTQKSSQVGPMFTPRRSDPTDSVESLSNSEIKNPSSFSSLSSSEVEHESSVSMINNQTEISKSSSSLGDSLRQADNTAHVMSRLVPLPLGMTSGEIPDENITASSVFDVYHNANQARLRNKKKDQNGGAWIPKLHDDNSFLDVDLGHVMTIEQVSTQGNPTTAVKHERHKRWVTKYSLEFSEDGKKWRDYEESGCVKEFIGNSDLDTVVLNSLADPVLTRFIRFKPKKWHNGIAMRVEIYGQKPLPESDEDDRIHTSPFEMRESVKDTVHETSTEDELEQLLTASEVDPEIEEFCASEERVITPAILQSPVPSLVSHRDLCIQQEDWQEALCCVNPLPAACVKAITIQTDIRRETRADQEQKEPNKDDEYLVNKELLAVSDKNLESHNADDQQDDDQQDVSEPNDMPAILESTQLSTNDESSTHVPESSSKRDFDRAETDGSVQRQLRRERIAEERREKFALMLSSSKSWRNSSESTASLEINRESDELGGFLEKYCIIGKSEAIAYKKVFEQFDRDEDGFLWPEEVLEALQEVNTNLLEDSHLSYVFRILEQCDCHVKSGTGLRLFTVIAALSQRVASLNNKMKILILKCDFKTIDSTLQRAKSLFECYVNEDTKKISSGDLWIGLAAGGLWSGNDTMEDCFEGKQNFDFLDFLTYLPLFQTIHGHVIDNPLTRIQCQS